jgi:hypothetical protein
MFRSGIDWLQKRTKRLPVAFWSPLTPAEVVQRLNQNLTAESRFATGYLGSVGPLPDASMCWPVRLSYGRSYYSSWRMIFQGSICASDSGTSLAGTLGPIDIVYGSSLLWLGFVAVFFTIGLIGLISDVATGHGLTYLPLVLVPLVMLAAFFVITGVASGFALGDWNRVDRWLSQLLELRGHPTN